MVCCQLWQPDQHVQLATNPFTGFACPKPSHASCAVLPLQLLPSNGKRYHEIRQGKVSMLPSHTMPFQNLIKVRQQSSSSCCLSAHLAQH